MAEPENQKDSKSPTGLMLVVLILLAGVCVLVLVVKNQATTNTKTPFDIRNRAVEQHLLAWLRGRLHDHWVNEATFLNDGTYEWGTTYPFEGVVSSQAKQMDPKPTLIAIIKYDNLEEGSVIVDIDSGMTHEFNKDTDRFQKSQGDMDLNLDSWKTFHIYVYGPTH